MNASLENVLLILFGWGLGLTSPIIVDAAMRRRSMREARTAVQVELEELQYRLASSAYQIRLAMGELDRENIQWFRSIVASYSGPQRTDQTLNKVDALLKLSDEELVSWAQHEGTSFNSGLTLKKFSAPVLATMSAPSSIFREKLRRQLLHIQTGLGFLNEEIENGRYYFRLTFDGGLPSQNYNLVVENLRKSYRISADQMAFLADQISDLVW